MNYICCPVRNNLALTKRAVASFEKQDIGDVQIIVVDNGSSDGTSEWLRTRRNIFITRFIDPLSVAESWNDMLRFVFRQDEDYALVVNNDVELRPDTYRHLVNDGGGFVTAVGVREWPKVWLGLPPDGAPDPIRKRPHPDFSCFLIRREVYETVGPFDENFKVAFCEDGDYDIRMYKAGIQAYCIDLPYLHHGSMTIKNADEEEAKRIATQADLNRKYFTQKWGFPMASPEYYQALGKGNPPAQDSV